MPTQPWGPDHPCWLVGKLAHQLSVENPDWSVAKIAKQNEINRPPATVNRWINFFKELEQSPEIERLSDVGYNIVEAEEKTPQEAWDAGKDAFERKLSDVIEKRWQTLKRPAGAGVIFHCTDPHVDDDGSALKLIEQDIKDSHGLNAIMCHGGDLLNNWPMAGRLARKWSEQVCTKPQALMRAEHYIDMFKPDVWVDGNHEEMNEYLADYIHSLLPKNTLSDYWSVFFEIKTPNDSIRCGLSHKFGKGSSWFHKLHGHIREMLESEPVDLLMDGHLHCDGVIDHTLPERGHSAVGVASGGYKLADEFARRISKSNGRVKIRGRAHWIVYDDQAAPDESKCVAFKSAQHAEAMLNGLQNLRSL